MSMEKSPAWLRSAEVILGLITILFGVAVIAMPGLAVATLILLLSLALVFLGIREIVLGAAVTFIAKWLRAVSIVAGIATLIFSFYVIAYPGIAALTLVLFLYVALFVRGIGLLIMGGAAGVMSKRLRAGSIVVGLISLVLAVVFLSFPGLAIATLILLLSIGLVITGLEVLVAGITGRTLVSVITGSTATVKA